ncbi:MAG: sigma-54 dependent transcriptional regulator [Desulfobacteraceae bacterium]|jgi:two-component system NtrC family response regulator
MAEILIIDDDKDMSFTLCRMVEGMGHCAADAFTLKEGLGKAAEARFDIVFLDVRLPDGNGLSIIPKLQDNPLPPEIIIVTAYGDPGGAELALKSGVWDYLTKPLELNEMRLSVARALQYRREKQKTISPVAVNRCGIVGESLQMQKCYDLLAQAAGSEAGVLITGETGTGKELFARAVHANSARSQRRFVVVDCAALPEQLVESILFGHVKGAFTGADNARDGLIKEADGGTLFLDEIGELPLDLQRGFLRVLQEHRFRPVGHSREIKSDFRLVAATNRDLEQMVEEGTFRKDLLFRIRTLVISLPPLRERSADIKDLILYHTTRLCERYGVAPKGYSPDCLETLIRYTWPGNVRELVNTLESTLTAARNEPTIYAKHLPMEIRIQMASMALEDKGKQKKREKSLKDAARRPLPTYQDMINETKRRYLLDLMEHTRGDTLKACKISGLPRSTLYDQLKKMGIPLSK